MFDNLNLMSLVVGAIVIVILLTMFVVGTPARADGGSAATITGPALATHNGSLMTVRRHGTQRVEIRYAEPRPGLWEIGVRPGTVLIHGQWHGPMLRATAYIFAYACGPVPYPVVGGVEPGGVLVLRGPAPIVDLYSCAIIDMAWTGNSTLIFAPVAQ